MNCQSATELEISAERACFFGNSGRFRGSALRKLRAVGQSKCVPKCVNFKQTKGSRAYYYYLTC